MMNWKLALTVLCAGVLLAGSGCATAKLSKDAVGKTAQRTRKQPPQVGSDLLRAFVQDDADAFLQLLPEVVREEFGIAGFRKTRQSMLEQLGKPVYYEYVLDLKHPTFTVSVWRIRCERITSDQSKMVWQDALFRVVTGKVDGKETLLSFNFF